MSTKLIIAALFASLPAVARADHPMSASVRGGVASYPSDAVALGPALGVEGMAELFPQLSLVVGGSLSRHGIDQNRGGGHLDVRQAGFGLAYLLDAAPVLPYLQAGVMIADRDTGRRETVGPWPYVGGTLVLPVRAPMTFALDARYSVELQSGLAQFGYAQIGLAVGFARGLSRP